MSLSIRKREYIEAEINKNFKFFSIIFGHCFVSPRLLVDRTAEEHFGVSLSFAASWNGNRRVGSGVICQNYYLPPIQILLGRLRLCILYQSVSTLLEILDA